MNKLWELWGENYDLYDSVNPLDVDFNYISSGQVISDYLRRQTSYNDLIDSYKTLQDTLKLYQFHESQRMKDDADSQDSDE